MYVRTQRGVCAQVFVCVCAYIYNPSCKGVLHNIC